MFDCLYRSRAGKLELFGDDELRLNFKLGPSGETQELLVFAS